MIGDQRGRPQRLTCEWTGVVAFAKPLQDGLTIKVLSVFADDRIVHDLERERAEELFGDVDLALRGIVVHRRRSHD